MTLDRLFNLSVPHFLHLYNVNNGSMVLHGDVVKFELLNMYTV